MKVSRIIALTLGLGISQLVLAQAPSGAPSGTTGQCKDGTYTSAPSKSGACRGHKGIQTWFAASAAKPAAAAKSAAATAAPEAKPSVATSKASNRAQAPGGGPGLVWVNTSTNVYHCSGTQFYGKTKAGKYMTEAQARAAGAHPERGKSCGQ